MNAADFDELMQSISGGSGDTAADNQMFGAGNMRHQRGPLDATYTNMPGKQTYTSGQGYTYDKGAAMDPSVREAALSGLSSMVGGAAGGTGVSAGSSDAKSKQPMQETGSGFKSIGQIAKGYENEEPGKKPAPAARWSWK